MVDGFLPEAAKHFFEIDTWRISTRQWLDSIVHGRTGVAKAMEGRERPSLATIFSFKKGSDPRVRRFRRTHIFRLFNCNSFDRLIL